MGSAFLEDDDIPLSRDGRAYPDRDMALSIRKTGRPEKFSADGCEGKDGCMRGYRVGFHGHKKQRPTRVDEETGSAYGLEPALSMEGESGKIRLPDTLAEKEPFAIHVRHLDVNHHVNTGSMCSLRRSICRRAL